MIDLTVLKGTVVKTVSRGGLLAMKYSPQILMGAGVVGVVASTVMACRATLQIEAIMDEAEIKLEKAHKGRKDFDQETYPDSEYQKDLLRIYTNRAASVARLYAPAAVIGAVSVSAMIGSNVILTKRNAAIAAAYKVLDQSFKSYRERNIAAIGEEKEESMRHGMTETTTTEIVKGEDGKKKKVESLSRECGLPSQYAVWFDRSSPEWQYDDPFSNLFHLQQTENFFNQNLHARGHVFLNEVYDAIGVPRTKAGQAVGWVDSGDGDGQIDFGLKDPALRVGQVSYVDGVKVVDDQAMLLDFNVDGVIWDLI